MKLSKEIKSDNVGSEIQTESNWSSRRNRQLRKAATGCCVLDVQPEQLNEGKGTDTNKKSGCDEKDKDVPQEVTLARNFTFKGLSGIFPITESMKDKMLEARLPNLKSNMPIFQAHQKCLFLILRMYLSNI